MATSSGHDTNAGRSASSSGKRPQTKPDTKEALQKKIAICQEEIDKEERYRSASRDARKMYGDITPGDVTHQDVTLEYTNHFKHAHRNLPKSFLEQEKYEVWRMSSDIVKESFEKNKEFILNKMQEDLQEALDLKKDTPGPLEEKTRDLHRAFKMMVEEMLQDDEEHKQKMEEIKQQVIKETNVDRETFEFVMDMIAKLDPADYKSFIENGEPRNRKADLEECYKRQLEI